MTYRKNFTRIKNTLELARNKLTNEIQMTAQRAYHSRKFDPKVQRLKNEQAASLEPLNEIVVRLSRAKTAIRRLNDAADAAKKTAADAFPAMAKGLLAEPVYDRMRTENPYRSGPSIDMSGLRRKAVTGVVDVGHCGEQASEVEPDKSRA